MWYPEPYPKILILLENVKKVKTESNFQMIKYFSELMIVLWVVHISKVQSAKEMLIMSLVTTKIVNDKILIPVMLSLLHEYVEKSRRIAFAQFLTTQYK